MNQQNHTRNISIVMVPLPAQGHLNQLLHLCRLVSPYHVSIHFLSTSTHISQATTRVHGWDPSATPNLYFHHLPKPLFANPQPNPNSTNKFPAQILPVINATAQLREHVHKVVQHLATTTRRVIVIYDSHKGIIYDNYNHLATTTRRVIVIYDSLMAYVVQDTMLVPNAEAYCFQSASAFTTYCLYWEVEGKPDISCDKAAIMVKTTPSMEGCYPNTSEFLEFGERHKSVPQFHHGDLYNTSRVMEGSYLDLLAKEKKTGCDKNWAIGPFHPLWQDQDQINGPKNRCLEWLDKQDDKSVLYISFGSTVSLSDEQISELALGLERSGHKFLWALKDADKGDIFEGEVRRVDPPEGFDERVEGRGLVVRDWVPQLQILGHRSTGGFMSHCGWNSCIESISMGVPIAAWPMHSDQPRNAVLITRVLRIGLEVREWAQREQVVSSARVEEVVRRLMGSEEGGVIRQRAIEMGGAIKEAMTENGVTRREMDSFIEHITR